jgi:hypothetical protein
VLASSGAFREPDVGYRPSVAWLDGRPGGGRRRLDHSDSGLDWRCSRLALFSGRVRNLETALATSESQVQAHLRNVENALKEYESKLNEQLASLSSQLVQVSSSVAEIPTSSPVVIEPAEQKAQDNIRENWARIRNRLEAIAADSKVDGRTRARYNRIDRRRYGDLVNALDIDGALGADKTYYRNAAELWQKFRTGRVTPSAAQLREMQELADRLKA